MCSSPIETEIGYGLFRCFTCEPYILYNIWHMSSTNLRKRNKKIILKNVKAMTTGMAQTISIKFHVKLGTYEMLKQVYGHDCLSRPSAFR